MAAKQLQCSPKRRLIFEKLSGEGGVAKCFKNVLDHHFNLSVGLVVPTFTKQKLCQNISSSFNEFCCLVDMKLTEFINPNFIQTFVKQGSVLALSHGTRIDTSDCVALLPSGVLHLSLTKDTYECLGLQGKPSPFNNNLRFDVEIDLLAQYFKPTKKYYERVKRSFQRMQIKLKFLVSSVSNPGTSSTHDLSLYFKSCGLAYQLFHCENKVKEFSQLEIPLVSYDNHAFSEDEPGTHSHCNSLSFHEWLGCLSCGIDCSAAAPDSFVNTLCCPTPSQPSEVAFCKWTGFLTSKSIQELVNKARKLLADLPEIPWLSILVWGFSDSPVSWRNRRHGYYTSGDNHYSLVVFPNDRLWMFSMLGDNDEQP